MTSPISRRAATVFLSLSLGSTLALASGHAALAQKKYDTGASDTEIKIGNIVPYSGPASAYGVVGKAMGAVFKKVNDDGGINGRKINFISYDDAYSPPKAVEQARKLIESDEVLLLFGTLGTASNTAIQKYVNGKKVPQLFMAATGLKWSDPRVYPWTMAFLPNQKTATSAYVAYLLRQRPHPKIGVLHQNDDFGKDYVKALRAQLGTAADSMIVGEASYEFTDPSVDSQIVSLKGAGADTLFTFASPKFAAQAIRKAAEIGWKPLHFIPYSATSVTAVLQPAGLERSVGVIGSAFLKDPTDPQWKNDAATKAWVVWMKKYYRDGDVAEIYNVYGYTAAQLMVRVLQSCGDDLSRVNIMKQAGNLKNVQLPMLLPGIAVNTTPDSYDPIRQLQLMQFDGAQWVKLGEVSGR